ncbi:MAG: phosphatase PAP2 family protein [Pseudobutyrivibrio sp.]|nr:phosphatase PAP2 family protein [Pseudobutyrivibrio sp.]
MNFSYLDFNKKVKNNNGLVTALIILDKAITYCTVIIYFIYLLYGFKRIPVDGGTLLYRSILVPGVSFIIVSIYRKVLSSPRPYEVYGFAPIIEKDTVGKSFPSRHVFSIFIIAVTVMQSSIALGLIIMFFGCALGFIRVAGGVHFIKDVIAAAILAIIIGIICYFFLGGVLGLLVLPF